jgi:hypothetical protein
MVENWREKIDTSPTLTLGAFKRAKKPGSPSFFEALGGAALALALAGAAMVIFSYGQLVNCP